MLADDFINKPINSNEVSFHHTFFRNKIFTIKTFSKTKQKIVLKNKNNIKIVEVNRIFFSKTFVLQYGNW